MWEGSNNRANLQGGGGRGEIPRTNRETEAISIPPCWEKSGKEVERKMVVRWVVKSKVERDLFIL